jgi:hypothetical protein
MKKLCIGLTLFLWTALAAAIPWTALPPAEQEALAPIQSQWDKLPEKTQRNFRRLAQQYPKLNPVQKKRFSSRLAKWASLTPAQRQAARAKYRAYKKQQQAAKLALQQPASAVPEVNAKP